MQIDTNKNYVFTGGFDDGEVGVFDIEKPGRVTNIILNQLGKICKTNRFS